MKYIVLLALMGAIFGSCSTKKYSADDPGHFRLITYNVWYGFTKVPQRKADWLDWMKKQQPDVVSLQELNEYTPEQLATDARGWGHNYSVLLKEDGFPTGFTSRYPIEDGQKYLEGFHHGLLRVRVQDIYFYVIHLHPGNWEVRHRELDKILDNMRQLPADSRIVLAGDFNTFSPYDSVYYQHGRLEPFFVGLDTIYENNKNLKNGRLDYGVLERLAAAGFTDMEYVLRPDSYVFTGTFPTLIEKEGEHGDQRRLDYVFVSANLRDHVQSAQIIANDTTWMLSDHLPVVADFEW